LSESTFFYYLIGTCLELRNCRSKKFCPELIFRRADIDPKYLRQARDGGSFFDGIGTSFYDSVTDTLDPEVEKYPEKESSDEE
jgi:hypothetical protein